VGQTVFFDGTPSTGGGITSYAWNFGDGSSATGSTTTHEFSAAGVYVVRLTVRNSAGSTATTTQNVTVGGTGTVVNAAFNFSPTNPVSNTLVSFNAGASSPLSSIVRFDWDFGDGTVINGQTSPTINHTFFNNVGQTLNYQVRLTVHTASGQTDTTEVSVPVGAGADPTALFTVSPSPATVGAVVTFNASTSGPGITRYEWDFGDGSVIQATTPPTSSITHSYAATGSYVIRLTVFDSSGRSGTTTRTLLVQ
jgi:PKD repeat protein